jgi:hypothetical protein
VIAGVAIIALLVWSVAAVRSDDSTTTTGPLGTSAEDSEDAGQAARPPASEGPSPVSEEPATAPEPPVPDPETEALSALNRLRSEDLTRVVLDERWVAQLASKAVGIQDPLQVAKNGTNTFYASDILHEHLQLRGDVRFAGDLIMLRSTDFGKSSTYNGEPFWVTLVLGGFPDRQSVLDWCAWTFPDLSGQLLENVCVPRTLRPPEN